MGWSWPWVLSAPSYFYINTLKLFIFLFFYSVLKRGQGGVSLFQSLVSLYSNRGLPPPSVCQEEEEGRGSPGSGIVFLHCDCFLVPRQQQGREQRLMDSSEPWEVDLLNCEDVIYSCNLFGDCR